MGTIKPTKMQASSFVSVYQKWSQEDIQKLNQADRKAITRMIEFLNSDRIISHRIYIDSSQSNSIFVVSKNIEGKGQTIRLKNIKQLPNKQSVDFISDFFDGIDSDILYFKIQNAFTIKSINSSYLQL